MSDRSASAIGVITHVGCRKWVGRNDLVIGQLLRLCILLGHHGAIEIGLLLLLVVVVEKNSIGATFRLFLGNH